jgi:hypothetical protein
MLLVLDEGILGALPLNLVLLSRQDILHNEDALRLVLVRRVGDLVSDFETL